MTNFFNLFTVKCDAPRPWGVYFQDSASPQMEALVELHDNIMFYLVIILFGVAWILLSIIRNYVSSKSPISNKYLNHGTLIELIWTISPALILILIALPSFKLLYLMDEVTDGSVTVFVEGDQWHWGYQYPDFLDHDDEELEFDSLVGREDLFSFTIDNPPGVNNGATPRKMFDDGCIHEFGNFTRVGGLESSEHQTQCDMSSPTNSHNLFKTSIEPNPDTRLDELTVAKQSYICKICNILVCNDCFTQCNINARHT